MTNVGGRIHGQADIGKFASLNGQCEMSIVCIIAWVTRTVVATRIGAIMSDACLRFSIFSKLAERALRLNSPLVLCGCVGLFVVLSARRIL